jgi:hypothetical protein
MAVAVLSTSTPSISNPFLMASSRTSNSNGSRSPSTSRSPQSPAPSSSPSPVAVAGPSSSSGNAFQRFIDQTFTRRTRPIAASIDHATDRRERESESNTLTPEPPRERPNVLRRIESKVLPRRAGHDRDQKPAPPISKRTPRQNNDVVRSAGMTFVGSMRGASLSSPTLLASSSSPPHSPRSSSSRPPPLPPKNDSRSSPTRARTRTLSVQPLATDVPSSISPSAKRLDANAAGSSSLSYQRLYGHRPSHSTPPAPPSSSTASLITSRRPSPQHPSPRTSQETPPSPPHTPTLSSGSRAHLYSSSRRPSAFSSTHLPLSSSPDSPRTTRGSSPVQSRSPSRVRPVQTRGFASASTSHLPPSPTTPSVPRRSSIDSERRPSADGSRNISPSPIRLSPFSLSESRHHNASTTSLSSPHNPEIREVIRTAITLLCKELSPPPTQRIRNEQAARDWEEVELRMRSLIRAERMWVKNPGPSTSQLNVTPTLSSTGLSAAGEERERRSFRDALRDGFVLCLYVAHLP